MYLTFDSNTGICMQHSYLAIVHVKQQEQYKIMQTKISEFILQMYMNCTMDCHVSIFYKTFFLSLQPIEPMVPFHLQQGHSMTLIKNQLELMIHDTLETHHRGTTLQHIPHNQLDMLDLQDKDILLEDIQGQLDIMVKVHRHSNKLQCNSNHPHKQWQLEVVLHVG